MSNNAELKKPSKQILNWQHIILGLMFITAVVFNQIFVNTQAIDSFIYDKQLQLLPISADESVVIVEIDEQSLFLLGDWPWPRGYHGQMIDLLAQADAQLIAYDVVFANADRDNAHDVELSNAIKNSNRTILPLYFDRLLKEGDISEVLPDNMFGHYAGVGHVNSYLDTDGILRSVRLIDAFSDNQWLHFSFVSYLFNYPQAEVLGVYENEVNIPFVNQNNFKHFSFVDVLTGIVPADEFANKTVFVGVTATSMGDPLLTPVDDLGFQSPAVEINANIYQALKHQSLIQNLPTLYSVLLSLFWIITALYLISRLSGLQQVFMTLIGLSGVWSVSYLLLKQGYWYHSAGVMIALVAIPFFWNLLRLSRLFNYFRQQVKSLQQKQKNEVFHLPELVRLENKSELSSLLVLLQIDSYQIIDSKGREAHDTSSKDALNEKELSREKRDLSVIKSISLKIREELVVLEICFEQFTNVEKRKLQILNQLLISQQSSVSLTNTKESESKKAAVDVFSQQLDLVESYQQQLEVSHSLFEASIEGISAGILVTDLIGRVLFKNKAFGELVDVQEPSISELFGRVPLIHGQWLDKLREVILSQKPITVEAKSGSIDLSISIRCIESQQDLMPLLVFNLTDISAIKQAHRSRNEMIDFLSHDLRSPLASLQALVNHARNSRESLEQSEIIEKVDHYSQRGLNFAEQFLNLAKVEGEEEIQCYEVDLYSVCQNALDSLYHQGKEKKISVLLESEDDCWVKSNGDLLERILINLVSNAIKYSPAETQVKVLITSLDDTSQVQVCVTDEGNGISDELLPNLFKPYQRGLDKDTQRSKGVGLGLRFVDVALKKLDSQIQVESSEKGSSFYFTMPKIEL